MAISVSRERIEGYEAQAMEAEAAMAEEERREADPDAYERKAWERETLETAAVLRPGQAEAVTLLDGRTIEIRPPKALNWITAAVRIQRCMRPLAMAVGMLRGVDKDMLESAEGQMLVFEKLTGVLSDRDINLEETLAQMLGVIDALTGMDEGWSAEQDLGDILAVAGALVRVIDPGRYAHFFGQARAAVRAQAAALRFQGPGK